MLNMCLINEGIHAGIAFIFNMIRLLKRKNSIQFNTKLFFDCRLNLIQLFNSGQISDTSEQLFAN